MSIEIPKIIEAVAEQIREYEVSALQPLRFQGFHHTSTDNSNELSFPPSNLLAMSDCADLSRPFPVTSHRKYSGRYIIFVKKVLMNIARPILKFFFQRQIIFNDNIVIMTHAVVAMESRINYLESLLNQQRSNESKKITS